MPNTFLHPKVYEGAKLCICDMCFGLLTLLLVVTKSIHIYKGLTLVGLSLYVSVFKVDTSYEQGQKMATVAGISRCTLVSIVVPTFAKKISSRTLHCNIVLCVV